MDMVYAALVIALVSVSAAFTVTAIVHAVKAVRHDANLRLHNETSFRKLKIVRFRSLERLAILVTLASSYGLSAILAGGFMLSIPENPQNGILLTGGLALICVLVSFWAHYMSGKEMSISEKQQFRGW